MRTGRGNVRVGRAVERKFAKSCLSLLLMMMVWAKVAGGRRRVTVSECGKASALLGRIIGGDTVGIGDYPWMVSVHEEGDHVCGGSIINDHWILTAAHCIDYPKKPRKYEIYAGLHHLNKKTQKRVRRHKISKIFLHEDYDPETFKNDIALLRTRTPIDIEGSRGLINGICLPNNLEDPTGWATVSGWGHTQEDGGNSNILKAVNVPVVPREMCNEAYRDEDYEEADAIAETMICAGTIDRDSCQNDSGGPMVQYKKGVYIQIGVVSHGAGCGDRNYPGVYTKVASYTDWMERHIHAG